MRLIKRYSNRKLYDTETRSYITLDGLASLVAEGEEIRVVDNDTKEDLTSVILSQLVLERERSQRFVPSAVFSQLLRGSENLSRSLSKVTRPLAALPLPQFLEQEIEKTVKFWSEVGQNSEEETLHLIENLIEKRRKHNRNESSESTTARRNQRKLDSFEEWSTTNSFTPSIQLSAEIVIESLSAIQQLSRSLMAHSEINPSLNSQETEQLLQEIITARDNLNLLLAELGHSENLS